jgi:protein-tyrosine phosphatase
MFSIFNRKKEIVFDEVYFPFVTDIHSHILPGIDDGSPDLETSLTLIKGLINLGIKESIATPHIIADMFRNDAVTIAAALNKLNTYLSLNNINFTVSAAAEYMMDDHFLHLLSTNQKLLTIRENYILTEFSYAATPSNIEQMAFAILTEGYRPLLAHPERYGYFHLDFRQYDRLKDLGFLFQLNLLSLTGYYGRGPQKAAQYLIKNNMVDFAGTDLHHERHLQALHAPANRKIFSEILLNRNYNEIFSSKLS